MSNEERSYLVKNLMLRSDIPAVTHVDYSARIQTVNNKTTKDTII